MKVRTTFTAGAVAAAAAGLALVAAAAVPAVAAQPASSPATVATAPAKQKQTTLPEQQVNELLTRYAASFDSSDPNAPQEVREEYLTADCLARVAQWEAEQHADGIFRAQNTPLSWTTAYEGSGAGHASVAVTFQWSQDPGNTTQVWYQVELSTMKVSDIEDAPQ